MKTRWKNACRADLLSILKLLNLMVQPRRNGALLLFWSSFTSWSPGLIAKSKIHDTQNVHCELKVTTLNYFNRDICFGSEKFFIDIVPLSSNDPMMTSSKNLRPIVSFLQTRSYAIASIPNRGWESNGRGWRVAILAAAQSIATGQALTGESMSWRKRSSGQIDNNTEQFRTCQLT